MILLRNFATACNSSIRHQLLTEALKCVPTLGWSDASLRQAATRLQLPSIAIGLVPRGPLDLIHFAQDEISRSCHQQHPPHSVLPADTSPPPFGTDAHRFYGNVANVMSTRLELMKPWIPRWPEALRILGQPAHVQLSVKRLADLSDQLCKSSSDPSYDTRFYMRRLAVGSLYASCEIFMTMDRSPSYEDTFEMMRRRCASLADTEQTAMHVEHMGRLCLKTIQGSLQ